MEERDTTEREGSVRGHPIPERHEPGQEELSLIIQNLEKRIATLSDAVLEQSTERAELTKAFVKWSMFAATAGAAVLVPPRHDPDLRNIALWLGGREGGSPEEAAVQAEIEATPSLDDINALFERLDQSIAFERASMDTLFKRIISRTVRL